MHEISDPNLNILRNAAFLRREFVGREITKELDGDANRRREKTIYIYDTDVIVTFCEPWRMGASGRHAFEGYGEIMSFPAENEADKETRERAMDVAAILAEHALFSVRSRRTPAFLFDGHHKETDDIYRRIADRVIWSGETFDRDYAKESERRLEKLAALIGWKANEIAEHPGRLSPLVSTLLTYLNQAERYPRPSKEDAAALRNLVGLRARTGGLYPASRAPELLKDVAPASVLDALRVFEATTGNMEVLSDPEKSDWIAIRKGFSDWLRPEQGADVDAIALLYLVNVRLKETDWRVVFVTGTTSVVNACHAGFPKIRGLDESRGKGIRPHFTHRFLRHLWAGTTEALLEPSEAANGQGREEQFVNWLDGFLADCSNPDRFEISTLDDYVESPRKFVRNGDTALAARVTRAATEWRDLTDKSLRAHRFKEIGFGGEAALKLQSKIVFRTGVSRNKFPPDPYRELVKEFDEEFQRERDLAYTRLSDIGIEVILSSRGLGLRNPPDLAFETLIHTNKIFKKLCSQDSYSNNKTRMDEFRADYEQIWRDSGDSRETDDTRLESYLRFLALGAAFASANLWGVALSQGELAWSIIKRSMGRRDLIPVKERDDGRKSFISGREARFLCASAQRMVARSDAHFKRARAHLDAAEKCLEMDWSKKTALSTTKLRFKGERLALELSIYYDARKKSEEVGENGDGANDCLIDFCDPQAAAVFNAADELLKYFEFIEPNGVGFEGNANLHFGNVPQRQRPSIIHKATETEGETAEVTLWPSFGKVSLLHIATNMVQVVAIRMFRALESHGEPDEMPLSPENLRFAVELIYYFTGKKDDTLVTLAAPANRLLRVSPLVRLYRETGALLVAPNATPEMKEPGDVDRLFLECEKEGLRVADYDDWRFPALKTLCCRLVDLSPQQRRGYLFPQP